MSHISNSVVEDANTRRTLPSLLRYVDHELMQSSALHDRPTNINATCPVCFLHWTSPITINEGAPRLSSLPPVPFTSTLLPLSPCGHWIHYHCLIQLTTKPSSPHKDECPICKTKLFEWEGITALTLATRTGLGMQDENEGGHLHPVTRSWVPSDNAVYETDCAIIDQVTSKHYFAQLALPPRYGDQSPDLVCVLYDACDELAALNKPEGKWLRCTTYTGSLLLGLLVAIKMRKFLKKEHCRIMETEAWRDFDTEVKGLQGRLLTEVHKP